MLVSYNWLSELVDISDIKVEEIAKRLTYAGVEVEGINKLSSASNLVVGKVLECEVIPDTHLHLCKIDLGKKYGVQQIVCGAPNVRKDLKVIVARPGAKLPGGEIKVSTIRGVTSNGMCCSLLELGVDSKYVSDIDLKGIHELDDSFEIGEEDILNKLGLDDTILNIKLLANRPDLLSIYNVAREVGCLFDRKVKPLTIKKHKCEKTTFKVGSTTDKCKQFSSRIIKGIKVKESPNELKKYLISTGVRPISNIVDIGNYIMLLTGQPLHMYDLDKLPKQELIVKDGFTSKFLALDEKEYQLAKEDLVVTSNNEAMCLAGVMGGLNSSDSSSTKNIVIEAANFNGASIRRTSIRLNLISESSNRFTHGINNNQYNEVIELATSLIEKYCGLSSVSEIVTYDKIDHDAKVIKCSEEDINNILGTNYSKKDIVAVLKKDNFLVDDKTKTLKVTVPDFRIDIDGVNDLAEEVVRILTFKDIKSELPSLKTVAGILNPIQKKQKEIEDYLISNSLYHILTYVLVNKKRVSEFNYLNNYTPYKVMNPLTDDHEYVRTSLTPSTLDVISYNLSHQNKDFGVFEISDINGNSKKDLHLSIALTGDNKIQGDLKKAPYSFYTLKGYLEGIMSILGIEKNRYTLKEWDLGKEEMHPNKSASIYMGKNLIGYLGELHPNIYSSYNIKNNKVYVMELNLGALLNTPTGSIKFKSIPKFPSVTRDLALLVNDDIKSDFIINVIKKSNSNLIKDVRVFDVYKDSSLLDKKSIAVTITLLNEEKTLNDNEINEAIEKVKAALLKENISIR